MAVPPKPGFGKTRTIVMAVLLAPAFLIPLGVGELDVGGAKPLWPWTIIAANEAPIGLKCLLIYAPVCAILSAIAALKLTRPARGAITVVLGLAPPLMLAAATFSESSGSVLGRIGTRLALGFLAYTGIFLAATALCRIRTFDAESRVIRFAAALCGAILAGVYFIPVMGKPVFRLIIDPGLGSGISAARFALFLPGLVGLLSALQILPLKQARLQAWLPVIAAYVTVGALPLAGIFHVVSGGGTPDVMLLELCRIASVSLQAGIYLFLALTGAVSLGVGGIAESDARIERRKIREVLDSE